MLFYERMMPKSDPEAEKITAGPVIKSDHEMGYDDNENDDHPKYQVELSKDLADVSKQCFFFERVFSLSLSLSLYIYIYIYIYIKHTH